jgi:hypothetical protein
MFAPKVPYWKLSEGHILYPSLQLALDAWDWSYYEGTVEKVKLPRRHVFNPVPLNKESPSPGTRFMWGLSGTYRGYYYATLEICEHFRDYAVRRNKIYPEVEKFELHGDKLVYGA